MDGENAGLFLHATDVLLLGTLLIAAWTDLRSRLIYDKLTFPAAALGIALQLLRGGLGEAASTPGLKSALLGMGVAALLFGIMWITGGMGAGDLKLATAVGAIVGFPAVVGALVAGTVVGGVQGLLAALARTRPGRRLCARAGMRGTDAPDFARTVPYGVSLAIGIALFWVWLRWPVDPPPVEQ